MLVDARGLSCPQPVMEAKNAVKMGDTQIEILLDNATAVANVTRFMKSSGYALSSSVDEADGSTRLSFAK
ncbi:MAG: sulfurtransferase TusA family protein [Pyramidobacter sp.]|nr:sulfurtransferase TusA family protein [Pyramidobacter sp.]